MKHDLASTFVVLQPDQRAERVSNVLIAGFAFGGAENVVHLQQPGEYVVVPKGTWHTARTAVPTKMLFVTPGEGTENKPV